MYDNPAYVTLRPFAYIFSKLGKVGQKHEVKKKKRRHNAAGGWYAVSVRHTGRYICSPGGGGVRAYWPTWYRCLNEKEEKGYFFQAGQCTALASFRIRKMAF